MTKSPAVRIDADSFRAGYDAGYDRKPMIQPQGVDDLSWISGFVEGKGDRQMGKPHCREQMAAK
ncbi:hypothetical protein ABAC460_17210 [Asticcacaulis sp. AC460]|nr:hypothetical protein ABAC460_17210 [Asticcacaulis sp. AC460]